MKKITKIGTNEPLVGKKKLKVAAYCRVSTASDEQLISLEAQKAHYESHIRANDEWEYVGLYYDEGITGTKKDVRAGLLSMIADCEAVRLNLLLPSPSADLPVTLRIAWRWYENLQIWEFPFSSKKRISTLAQWKAN